MSKELSGIDELRSATAMFNWMREGFNLRFTAEDLLKLARAHRESEYDIPPDEWTGQQVEEALRGKVPRWEEKDGKVIPIHD